MPKKVVRYIGKLLVVIGGVLAFFYMSHIAKTASIVCNTTNICRVELGLVDMDLTLWFLVLMFFFIGAILINGKKLWCNPIERLSEYLVEMVAWIIGTFTAVIGSLFILSNTHYDWKLITLAFTTVFVLIIIILELKRDEKEVTEKSKGIEDSIKAEAKLKEEAKKMSTKEEKKEALNEKTKKEKKDKVKEEKSTEKKKEKNVSKKLQSK